MIRNEKVQDLELIDGNGCIIKNTGFLTSARQKFVEARTVLMFFSRTLKFAVWASQNRLLITQQSSVVKIKTQDLLQIVSVGLIGLKGQNMC